MTQNNFRVTMMFAAVVAGCTSCNTLKPSTSSTIQNQKRLVAVVDRDWVRYEIFRSHLDNRKNHPVTVSIRVFDKGGESPLRKISGSLEQYNVYYEYLLNQVRYDMLLTQGAKAYYPTGFIFENGYRALPFETIVVTYDLPKLKKKQIRNLRFVYLDKVFSHDTLSCTL